MAKEEEGREGRSVSEGGLVKSVLVTGGAGFIGSHLIDELLSAGYEVRVLDSLCPQVHGERATPPEYLDNRADFMRGDVTDSAAVRQALEGMDAVVHLAAAVGVGQSMYEVRKYTDTNNMGTATLLEALIERPVRKLVVASSMSIYGEGLYRDRQGNLHEQARRSAQQLKAHKCEPCGSEGEPLEPLPTPESKPPTLSSIYALGKYDQERMCLLIGQAYEMPAVALRFFNVFGTRQALSNPYTGVLAIFASRYLNDKPPLIFEDGRQKRDFVSVYDVARACRLALEKPQADQMVLNIGSGRAYTILEVARKMAAVLGREDLAPDITGKYRVGDIRHCFADISRAGDVLDYQPRVSLEEGLDELAEWLSGQVATDRVDKATEELKARGLAK